MSSERKRNVLTEIDSFCRRDPALSLVIVVEGEACSFRHDVRKFVEENPELSERHLDLWAPAPRIGGRQLRFGERNAEFAKASSDLLPTRTQPLEDRREVRLQTVAIRTCSGSTVAAPRPAASPSAKPS